MFKTLTLCRDLLALGQAAIRLAGKGSDLRPQLDTVLSDAADLVTSPDFEHGEKLLADVDAAWKAAVESYGSGDAIVAAFKDAVAKLVADARG